MKDRSILKLRSRYQVLKSDRSNVEGIWKEIESHVMPFRGDFFKEDIQEGSVEWKKRWIYDSTPVNSAISLAASLNGSLTSPVVKWFSLGFRSEALNSNSAAKAWLEECGNICWSALSKSNFNLEINESYLDLVGFGNSVLVEEIDGGYDDFRGLDFKAIPVKECFFENNYKEKITTFYRRLFLTPVQMVDRFGIDGVPEEFVTAAESSTAFTERHEVVFCIYERDDIMKLVDEGTIDLSKPLATKQRPFGKKWFIEKTGEKLGETGGAYEMPAYHIRWSKVSGSIWGFGPAHIAMGDILTLNQLVEMILVSGEKVIDPATLAEDRGIVGDLDLNSGGLTIVRKIDGLKPYESRARFDVSQLQKEELQDSIRKIFHIDQLELKESPAMTATEVTVRYELMQRLLGPTLGRMQSDVFDPLIQRTFNILFRSGELPEIPGVVLESNAEMQVDYMGPMARSQKSDTVVSIERFIASLSEMSGVYPEVLSIIDPIKVAREHANLLSIPAKVMRTDEEIQKIQKEKEKLQAQQQQLMMAQQGGEAMKSIGEGQQAMGGMNGQPGTAEQVR